MAGTGLTQEALVDALRLAEARKSQALADYQKAAAEISWLLQGLRLLDVDMDAYEESTPAIAELFPDLQVVGGKPTLRQAIVAVMRENPSTQWRVTDLTEELVHRGWLPGSSEAGKRVSDMAGLMVGDDQLTRLARGVYGLAPQLAAEFELAGWPAPDFAGRNGEGEQ